MTPTQTTKKVAIRCWSNNEHYNADFDYAVVEITAELAAKIETRRALFTVAAAQDNQLLKLTFWDYSPAYFSESDLNPDWDQLESVAIDAETQSLIDGGEIAVLPAEFNTEMHADDRDFYTECDQMEVTEFGVRWTCTPKHSSITIETAELAYKDLADLAG